MRSRSTHPVNNVTPIQQHTQTTELRSDLWDDRYSEKEREKLAVVAQQYGLDPMTKEVMILHGNIYVTASGLQKLALQDPEYNGCEIELVETDWANNFFMVKARIWKKNCAYPFEDYGDADPTTSHMRGHALFRHAITRARARAMRSAFAVPFCSLEELDDETRWRQGADNRSRRPKNWKGREETPGATATDVATEQQHVMVARYRKELKLEDESFTALLQSMFQVDGMERLSRSQCSQLLDTLSQQKSKAKKDLATQETNTPILTIEKIDKVELAKTAEATELIEKKEETRKSTQAEAVESDASTDKVGRVDAKEDIDPATLPEKQPVVTKGKKQPKKSVEEPATHDLFEEPQAKQEPTLEEPEQVARMPRPKPKTTSKSASRSGVLPRWTVEEQKRIANDLVERMQGAKTLKELRREWELFQGVRHQLSEEWFAQICETKEQRKSALTA